jgi:TolA-binding protein
MPSCQKFNNICLQLLLTLIVVIVFPLSLFSQIIPLPYSYSTKQFLNVNALLEQGMLQKARIEIQNIIKSQPKSTVFDATVIEKSRIERSIGNYRNSEEVLSEFIAKNSTSPFVAYAWFERALLNIELKNYPLATEYLLLAAQNAELDLRDRSDSSYAELAHISWFWSGSLYAVQNNFPKALQSFNQCVERSPKGAYADDALLFSGVISQLLSKFTDATTFYTRGIEKEYYQRNSTLARFLSAAQAYLSLSSPTDALIVLDKAKEWYARYNTPKSTFESPDYLYKPEALMFSLIGDALYMQEDFERAIVHYELSYEKDSTTTLAMNVLNHLATAQNKIGNKKEAKRIFERVLSKTENDTYEYAYARYYRSILLYDDNKKNDALQELTILVNNPDFPFLTEALLTLGQIQYVDKNYDKARPTLERTVRTAETPMLKIQALLLLGAVYMNSQNISKASAQYEQAFALMEKLPKEIKSTTNVRWFQKEYLLKYGICQSLSNKQIQAIDLLSTFIAENPEESRVEEALFWLGESYFKAENFQDALVQYQMLLKRFPYSQRSEEAQYAIGYVYFKTKEFDKSANAFSVFLKEYSFSKLKTDALARKGDALYAQNKFQEASQSYKASSDTDPNSPEAQYSLFQNGQALFQLGEFEQTAKEMREFIKRYPKSAVADDATFLIGLASLKTKNYKEARKVFQQLIDNYPSSELQPRAYYYNGDAFYSEADYESAILKYKYVLDNYPTSPFISSAAKSLAQSYENLGRSDEALVISQRYINNTTTQASEEFRFINADIYFSKQQYAKTIEELQEYLQLFPEGSRRAEAMFLQSKSYILLGNAAQAKEKLNELLKLYPKSDYTEEVELSLADVTLASGDLETANELFQKIQFTYSGTPLASKAAFKRATIALLRNDTLDYIAKLQDIPVQFPQALEVPESYLLLGKMFTTIDSTQKAYDAYSQAYALTIESNPLTASEALYEWGMLLYKKRQYRPAAEKFSMIRNDYEDVVVQWLNATFALVECYVDVADKNSAKKLLQEIIDKYKDDSYGVRAAERMKKLNVR